MITFHHEGLSDLIASVRRTIQLKITKRVLIESISADLGAFIALDGVIPSQFLRGSSSGYSRNLVHRESGLVLLAMVWRPGDASPVHDHCTWGVVGVYEGLLRVTNYALVGHPRRERPIDLRVRRMINVTRASTAYVLPPHEEIHKVENVTQSPSVSLHIYGKEITTARRYDLETGEIEPYPLSYSNC